MLDARALTKNLIAVGAVTAGLFTVMTVPAISDEPTADPTPSAAVSTPAPTTEVEPSAEPEPTAEPTPTPAPTTSAPKPSPTPTATASKAARAASAPAPGEPLLVFGDSTSAWFSDQPGSPSQGWWSKVAAKADMRAVLSAESGSGMWARGNKCGGTRFDQRLSEIARIKPAKIIVATGRNDYHRCRGGQGQGYVTSPRAQVELAISNYMTKLDKARKAEGIPANEVYVTTPWGTDGRSVHSWMWKAQKREAEKRGFTYVTVRFLDDLFTLDKTHPNALGNTKLADDFLRVSKIAG